MDRHKLEPQQIYLAPAKAIKKVELLTRMTTCGETGGGNVLTCPAFRPPAACTVPPIGRSQQKPTDPGTWKTQLTGVSSPGIQSRARKEKEMGPMGKRSKTSMLACHQLITMPDIQENRWRACWFLCAGCLCWLIFLLKAWFPSFKKLIFTESLCTPGTVLLLFCLLWYFFFFFYKKGGQCGLGDIPPGSLLELE